MITVTDVHPESIGHALGVVPGTQLQRVNGKELEDFLDWEFLTAEDAFEVEAVLPDGESVVFDIERQEGDWLGIEVEPPRIRRCGNRCDFCFVDGLPEGLRSTLYVRDDDYRLSFRHGNFATLTNLKGTDVERIIEYRLSPLYVSVHATDPVMRRRLLRNPLAPDIVEQLKMFNERAGIVFHTQIVMQPGVNDGDILERSLHDLYELGEMVLSAAVVPVGLTEFSRHDKVREPDAQECGAAVDLVERFAAKAIAERGERWVQGSDELYLRADRPLPPAEAYGNWEQVENGVGSVRYLEEKVKAAGDSLRRLDGKRIAVLTGTAMGRLMPEVFPVLQDATGASFELIVLENTLMGPLVTTAGLLPGKDFIAALEGREGVDLFLLPAEAVNDQGLLLDDVPDHEVEHAAPAALEWSYDFVDVLSET